MYCRNCGAKLDSGSTMCQSCRTPIGVGTNFCPNCGVGTTPSQVACSSCGFPLNNVNYYSQQTSAHSKLVAGLLAIFLGNFGVHNFYLGYTSKGIAQVLTTIIGGVLTCGIASFGVWIWALVEGILILSGYINTDARGVPLSE